MIVMNEVENINTLFHKSDDHYLVSQEGAAAQLAGRERQVQELAFKVYVLQFAAMVA